MIARVHLTRGSAWQATATYREAVAMAEPDGNAQVVAQAWAGLARTCYADDLGEAARYAELSLTLPSAAGPVTGELAAGWVALCSGDTASAAQYAADVRSEAGRRRDPAGLAEAMELAALAAYRGDSAAMPGRPTARRAAGLVEAAAVWADTGNEVALATNALLRARHAGDRLSEDVAWQRLHRLGCATTSGTSPGRWQRSVRRRSPRLPCRPWATWRYCSPEPPSPGRMAVAEGP